MRLLTISFFLAMLFALPSALCAQGGSVNTNQTTNELDRYEATINATLRTFRDEEKKFIADSIELVRQGKLPQEIIDRSFLWVRKNRRHSRYRFIYFERVMRVYATRSRATIPAFDYSIYNLSGSQTFKENGFNGISVSAGVIGNSSFGGTTNGSFVIPAKTFGSQTFGRR